MSDPWPTDLRYSKDAKTLTIVFDDGVEHVLPAEYMRVYSPSAEVRGHGVGQEILQAGKRHVAITAIEPVGNYAIKPTFDDGHNSGIFSWETLFDLATNQAARWADYTARLSAAGASREPLPADTQVIKFMPS